MSQVPVTQLTQAIGTYLDNDLIPNIPPTTIPLLNGLIPIEINSTLLSFVGGAAMAFSANKIDKAIPVLKTIGIVDERNMVDLEKSKAILTAQLEKVGGKLPIGALSFTQEDFDKIIGYAESATIKI